MRKRRTNWPFWTSLFVVVISISGGTALVVFFAQADMPVEHPKVQTGQSQSDVRKVESPEAISTDLVNAAPPRRMPVVGAPGFSVVVNSDGSSFMEDPDGKRTQLAAAGEVKTPVDMVVGRVVDRVTQPPKKVEIGQLVVCDKGVVDVPRNAIITLIGEDKVVTHNPDGSSTAYYTDGRVIRRDRVERKADMSSAPPM